jgi:ribosomal protein L39E
MFDTTHTVREDDMDKTERKCAPVPKYYIMKTYGKLRYQPRYEMELDAPVALLCRKR